MYLSAKEKIIKAINCEDTADFSEIPFTFMLFSSLRKRCNDEIEFIEKQLKLGLDPVAYIGERPFFEINDNYHELYGLPIDYHPEVKVIEWIEKDPNEKYPIIHKEYLTPEGPLEIEVKKNSDWPYSYHIPLMDDYIVSRMKKPLIKVRDDLKRLKYLLTPPNKDQIKDFKEQANKVKSFAEKHDLPIAAKWAVGIEAFVWFFGVENFLLLAIDDPDFVKEFASFMERFSMARNEVYLDFGVDFIVRRAWYENTDLWSVELFKKFIFPGLKKECMQCHAAGAKLVYGSSGAIPPLLDLYIEAGVDVLQGVDPIMGIGIAAVTDLKIMKEKLNKKICLWGGVNQVLTVEMGTDSQIREAVRNAIRILSPGGGFILSPAMDGEIWERTYKFIEIAREELNRF
jgi:hypothetical protein